MELVEYKKKRNFKSTPEPAPRKGRRKGTPLFVVQMHKASHTHFDLRLEVDGVLKSWSIPKGPSMNPEEKRMALLVEDHPMAYAKFEGVIPEGQYGAGEVTIWDTGVWVPAEKFKDIKKAIEDGLIEFTLRGNKLKGSFILVRLEYSIHRNGWLLIKREDDQALNTPYDAINVK